MEKKNVICYTRQSLIATEHDSEEKQSAFIKEYCDANGLELVAAFHDLGASGEREDRQTWKELVQYIETHPGQLHALIVTDYTRLTRSVPNFAKLHKTLCDYNLKLLCTFNNSMRSIPLTEPDEWDLLMASIGH